MPPLARQIGSQNANGVAAQQSLEYAAKGPAVVDVIAMRHGGVDEVFTARLAIANNPSGDEASGSLGVKAGNSLGFG